MKNVLRKTLVLASTLALGVGITSCTSNEDSEREVLVVGMECAYQPFNWTATAESDYTVPIANVTGAYADGYDIQIAKRIASELDMDLEVRAIEWGGLTTSLTANQIDLIIAGMSNTAERRETIDFTNGYYTSEEVILLRQDNAYASSTGLSDFSGAKIAGQLGTLYVDMANQAATRAGAIVSDAWNLETVGEIMNLMNSGMIDATVVELPVAQGLVAANPEYKYIRLDADDTFETNPEDVEVCIGLRKGYELKDRINEILATISTDERNELMQAAVTRAGE